MIARIGTAAKSLLVLWLKSWLFLLWSMLCAVAGAVAMQTANYAALAAVGIL